MGEEQSSVISSLPDTIPGGMIERLIENRMCVLGISMFYTKIKNCDLTLQGILEGFSFPYAKVFRMSNDSGKGGWV